MKKFLYDAAERLRSKRDGRTETQYEIVWNESDVRVEWVTMENETGLVSFRWDTVSAVDTFKRDLFNVDCICLAFETPDGWIEVNDDMRGWGEFLIAVEAALHGFPPQAKWWQKVMIPAFATNHQRLWTEGERSRAR